MSAEIISQIAGGFTAIVAGDIGLQLAVIIIAVIGIVIGFWRAVA